VEIAKDFIPRYTLEDYKHWEGDWELIDGIPYAMAPSPVWKHQRLSLLLAKQIEEQLENCTAKCFVCQEVDWIVNENTVVRPDIVVVCGKVEGDEHLKKVPEVIFEIVSKATVFKDEKVKFKLYEEEGVKYYVLVYPDRRNIKIFELKDDKYGKVFEGGEGKFTFSLECPLTLEFTAIWKRI